MQALILNSGIGKRMGSLTHNKPKCLIELANKETILFRQLRLLSANGITDIIITTGPFEEKIKKEVERFNSISPVDIEFVHNDIFKETNYIYSMYLTKDKITDDLILLHGDLVFTDALLSTYLNSKHKDSVLINKREPVPKKDFKGKVVDDHIKEIGVNLFGDDCFVLMPLYKFQKLSFSKWMEKIDEFIKQSQLTVYAENALNQILDDIILQPFDYSGFFCSEIDDIDDLEKVNHALDFGSDSFEPS